MLRCRRHLGRGRGVAGAGIAMALLAALAGCGSSTGSAHTDKPVLLAQAKGICPMKVVYNKQLPSECVYDRDWNGAIPIFKTPRRLWGVAYAFNCGSHPQSFSFDARLPGMDHMALPGPERHTTRGSGYIMYSRSRMLNFLSGVPSEFSFDGKVMTVDVASPCTWHIKALLGSQAAVASAVPPIPAMQPRWWT